MTGTARRLLGPGLMTAGMLIVLLGLGTWQVKRLFWKEALLAQIDRAEAAPPVPLPAAPSLPAPFTKVSATGRLLPDKTALYGADVRTLPSGPEMGARMIEAMREADGRVILVDRGWVPLKRDRPIDEPSGPVTVSGYARPGDSPHWFSVRDDVPARRFFTLDPKAIGAAIGEPDVPPFVLVILGSGPPPPGGDERVVDHWPDPARHLPRPPNNHLVYAVTWYGLAVALLAIFVVWARKGSRS